MVGNVLTQTHSLVCEDCKLQYPCGVALRFSRPELIEAFMFEHYGHAMRLVHNDSSDQRSLTYMVWKHGTH